MAYTTTIIGYSIHEKGKNPIYSETATQVYLDDEAAGFFLRIEQSLDDLVPGQVKLELEELRLVYEAGKKLLEQKSFLGQENGKD